MGEGGRPHVGLLRVGGDVDELGDVVRDRGDPLEPVGGDGPDVQLEREVGDRGGEVGVAGPLPVAVHASLDVGRPGPDPGDGVGHRATRVVVEVDPDLRTKSEPTSATIRSTSWGRVPPLVSQSTRASAPASSAAQDRRGEARGCPGSRRRSARRRRRPGDRGRGGSAPSRPPSPRPRRASCARPR